MVCQMGTMGNMSGCFINNMCKSQSDRFTGQYCGDFLILKELCTDMPMKPGCNDYISMCEPNSTVLQCHTKVLPIPSSMELGSMIQNICENMNMDGCDQCDNQQMIPCNVLEVYSGLCQQMPEMEQCDSWHLMCRFVSGWPICQVGNGNLHPEMRMYFHSGIDDYILFQQWVPTSKGQYAGSFIAVLVFAFLFEAFRYLRARLEKKWAAEGSCHEEYTPLNDKSTELNEPAPEFRWHVDIPRSLLQFLEVAWSLALMLVAMTFNIGLFIALCAGSAFGVLVFGRFLIGKGKSSHH